MRFDGGRLRLSASDVANFVACGHVTRLDLLHARGIIAPPRAFDVGFQDLVARGAAHEARVLERFRAEGWRVVEIDPWPEADAAWATLEAIRDGADVVSQGVLLAAGGADGAVLLGRPDFLVRAGLLPVPEGEPRSAGAHYEVVDAKLARSAKARAVAQIGFYSDLLAGAQGVRPRRMHLALGDGEFTSLKVDDYAAYERQARRMLGDFIDSDPGENPPSSPYPEPVEHCAICRWSERCSDRRRRDDDLSLIAGITAQQRRALKGAEVTTRRGFASLAELPEVRRASRASLLGAQVQARLQVDSEDAGRIAYELLDPERDAAGVMVGNRGLLALPEPVVGDLFFDIEGARYYSEDGKEFGLQYLFGIIDTADVDESGTPRYIQIWSFDRRGEQRAFEEIVDFITERHERVPDLHVYHYNHYETTAVDHLTELHETRQEAVGRLMGRFATREDEVDDLFRGGVFVDLYRVVRQGIRAGVESYSIKRLEPLCGYARQVDLRDATAALIAFEAALDYRTAEGERDRRRVVAGYNEDDCRATIALRDWLEERRTDLALRLSLPLSGLPRPLVEEKTGLVEDPELAEIRAALLAGVPDDPAARSAEQHAKALLADLLDWHRREAKPGWWRYFYLRTLGPAELIGEPDTIGGLAGGDVVAEVKRSVVRRFTFPPQEHKFAPSDGARDSVTDKVWPVVAIDDAAGTIDLKVGARYDGPLPIALLPDGPIPTQTQRARLRELGVRVARDGATGRGAATALLLRARPADGAVAGAPLRGADETTFQAAVRLVLALHDSYLPIQGPPGTGKTFTAANQILDLIAAGRTVGITGPSHAVIGNLIGKVYERADARGATPRVGQRSPADNQHLDSRVAVLDYEPLERGIRDRELDVIAGTSWMWSREQFAGSVDVLFVDEAGQLSLADVLSVAHAAGTLVLLGDPQQLAQPSEVAHPPGTGVSALEHILGDHATIPPDAGLLLDRTWRMHPRLCWYTSDAFYDGRLTAVEGLERQEILGEGLLRGAGLRIVEVPHEGNSNCSPEEAGRIAGLVSDLLGYRWRDQEGAEEPIGPADILIITPYNAQIRAIREALSVAGCPAGIRVGTVDKFQGREAPVAIYSMATSSADEASRGLEFLYDHRRLNVATSRAKAMAIIVASPSLVQAACHTPRQMLLVNALCRAWESAGQLALSLSRYTAGRPTVLWLTASVDSGRPPPLRGNCHR
jgi:predicted RecB family nuclease